MLIAIPSVLDAAGVARLRAIVDGGRWADGNATSGAPAALAKRNEQLVEDDPATVEAGRIVLDALGNVAETCSSNVFLARNGVVATPVPTGAFLAGITRNRTVKLLRNAGIAVEERTIKPAELDEADEIFTTGNAGKVQPVSRYEDRDLQPGPIARQAHELYMAFARTQRII